MSAQPWGKRETFPPRLRSDERSKREALAPNIETGKLPKTLTNSGPYPLNPFSIKIRHELGFREPLTRGGVLQGHEPLKISAPEFSREEV